MASAWGRIADELMPVLHRNLACDDGGPAAVTVLKDLEKVVTRSGVPEYLGDIIGIRRWASGFPARPILRRLSGPKITSSG
jgi:hypothetical protein